MRVAQLPDEEEVHLAHSVAHVLRTEQAAVRFDAGLYRFDLPAHVVEQLFQYSVTVRLGKKNRS